ncbi:DNA primase [Serratia oryzae]|uniref:DNA primase n=3 Tax=cellular organisms TaxID=131567 RepID=A0A1S8CGM3_9GAMM|nr:DNA primase [Serratia oryzae]
MSKFVSDIAAKCRHRWPSVLAALNISILPGGKHGPCPACGGKDRFRFDDKQGRGTWFCNQCGHGDGLDLIALVKQCDLSAAAKLVASLTLPASTAPAREKAVNRLPPQEKIQHMLAHASSGKSAYLKAKGLSAILPCLTAQQKMQISGITFDEGSLLLTLHRVSGELTGAQLINASGEKRLMPGSQLKGAFITVSFPKAPETIVIAEGYATGLTLSQTTTAAVVAAVSANNLMNVAKALRNEYPEATIILAGDHDIHTDGSTNIGKELAEKAALAVDGWVSLPPATTLCDWDDFRQQYGLEATKTAFNQQRYKPSIMPIPLTRIDYTAPEFNTSLPLRKGSDGFDTRQDYLIKGYLPSSSVASAYGASGSYKSFLAVSWGCHIATGKPWAGKPVTQGAVIYVVGEGGIGVPRRIRAWEQTINGGSPIDALYRVDCPIFPASPESVQQVIQAASDVKAATGMPIRLIILDTLARCFGGSDENAAKDMGAFIQGCDYIKAATQATVLIIHHSGKDQDKGARGSSAFRAALDVEFNVRREGDGGALILSCTKMKDAEEPSRRAYDLNSVDLYVDDDGDLITSLVLNDEGREVREDDVANDPDLAGISRLTENHVALWQAIRSRTASGDSCTRALVRDDMKAMGFDVSKKFARWLDKLEKDGLIAFDGEHITPLPHRNKVGD